RKPEPIVEIVGTGRYVPDRVLTNQDLEEMVETSDAWIVERTGIRERRIAGDDETVAEMGAAAARCAMQKAGIEPGEVDILIVSTATPDRLLPSTACDAQALLGADNALAFDVSAACSGWLYGLTLAEGYLAAGRGEVALVVAAEKMSSIVDWTDRSTCVLFGDGAGAAVLKPSSNGDGILSSYHRSDGKLADLLFRPGGGAAIPMDAGVLERRDHLVKMEGREVFRNAVRSMSEAADHALREAGLTASDVDLMIPHQANIRIIEATAKYADIPMEKVYVNVDRYGNMSSATIPVALDEAVEQGRLEKGMNVLFAAFGAGLTWGATVFRW
ncbi:MAG TPA: beta-ketoacyl-ACP synthase III, partial [Longimicrobiales bacterium]|nr:beta-ketoacyl-ACP synthase III [Longimicrobiales bacterium]